jgi:hypothetical protein
MHECGDAAVKDQPSSYARDQWGRPFPITEVQAAGYHARYLVNKGLRDIVVDYLGEPPLPRNPANLVIYYMRLENRRGQDAKIPYGVFFS